MFSSLGLMYGGVPTWRSLASIRQFEVKVSLSFLVNLTFSLALQLLQVSGIAEELLAVPVWTANIRFEWPKCKSSETVREDLVAPLFSLFFIFFFFCCAKTKTWPCPKNITFSLLICHEHSPICSCSLDYLCLHNRSYRSLKKLCSLGKAYVSYQSLFWFEILAPFLIHFGPVVWVIYLSLQIRFIVSCTVRLPLYFLLDIVKTQKLRGRMQIAKPGISCVMWLLFLDNLFLIIHMHIIHL